MKKLSKNLSWLFLTCFVFFVTASPALAFSDDSVKEAPMTAMQVIGGFAILLLIILLPLVKKSTGGRDPMTNAPKNG